MERRDDIQIATELLAEDIKEVIKTARLSKVPIATVLQILDEAEKALTDEYQKEE